MALRTEIMYLFTALTLLIVELVYFKIAKIFNIVDTPNHRSSHSNITIRGGGVIFTLAILIYPLFFPFQYWYFLVGLLLISSISFIDDIKELSSKVRISIHLLATILLFLQLEIFNYPIVLIILITIFVLGIINAINFMDGINGITGGYAFITLWSLYAINRNSIPFIESSLIMVSIIAVCIFNFFNFRKKAMCFAGDVGSVGIAFLLIFFISKLIIVSGNISYLLLLLLYGLDTMSTILFRLIRKENILEAHRSHYYQYLANERKIPHLYVSLLYSIVQLLINVIAFHFFNNQLLLFLFPLSFFGLFIALRFWTEGKDKLMRRNP